MANSFFKNGDKAYSENLNDSVLVGNAFDWTVNVGLPADSGGTFPNSSTVVKAKVADVSITPNSNLSIGSTISNSSGSSQVYRLTVYPNFNRFGGFKSISLTADEGVTFYIANKGGSSPIANNLDYTNLGNVPELKVLKEYDIVLTIPSGKSVTGLSFVFQSSSADVSGSISKSNVTGLEDTLDGIYNYRLYHSVLGDSNVDIDSTVSIMCKCTDVDGNVVSGKELTLYQNNISKGTATTNSGGVATWTVECSSWGLQEFRVGYSTYSLLVDGWRQVWSNNQSDPSAATVKAYQNGNRAKLLFSGYSRYCTNSWTDTSEAYLSSISPSYRVVSLSNNPTEIISVTGTGFISVMTTGANGTKSIYGQLEWSIG